MQCSDLLQSELNNSTETQTVLGLKGWGNIVTRTRRKFLSHSTK